MVKAKYKIDDAFVNPSISYRDNKEAYESAVKQLTETIDNNILKQIKNTK